MITDAQLTFSNNQAITVDAASANQIDLTVARNLARSNARGMRLVVLVTTTFATTVSLQVTVRQSAAANMSSPDIIATGPVVVLANLTKGSVVLDIPFPDPSPVAAKQFMDVYYDISTTATAGAVWAGIVLDSEGGHLALGNVGR